MSSSRLSVRKKILSLLFFCALLSNGCLGSPETKQVCYQNSCFSVEVVSSGPQRKKGLMFRGSLPADHGMLFIFDRSYPYRFWMKNTFIPLDIIWIDKDYQIVHIEHNVPPCKKDPCSTYSPKKNALYVLEVNAGRAEVIGLKEGASLKFNLGSR